MSGVNPSGVLSLATQQSSNGLNLIFNLILWYCKAIKGKANPIFLQNQKHQTLYTSLYKVALAAEDFGMKGDNQVSTYFPKEPNYQEWLLVQ